MLIENIDTSKTLSILVADDDPLMRKSVEELLNIYDYSCTLVENGKQVLSTLKQQHFNILLLDLMMPEMNGHQVMLEIEDNYPNLDIIIVSGEASFENAKKALRQGAKDFISKPYKPEDLIKSIRHIEETQKLKSEINRMQQQVVLSEQRYRFFINHSPDLIYILDKKGRFSFVNDRVKEMLGYEAKELKGKHYSHIVHSNSLCQLEYTLSQNELYPDVKQTVELNLIPKDSTQSLLCFESDTIVINMILTGLLNQNSGTQNTAEQVFSGIYGVARDITEKKSYKEQLSFQLYYDSLTSLPNRVLFKDRMNFAISHAQRNHSKFAVLSMDINRFKTINDSLGHAIGDKLLHSISTQISQILRNTDTLARIGGDDFLLLLADFSSTDTIEQILSKINQLFITPFVIDGNDIFTNLSIGIAIFPKDGEHPDILIKHAEMAMYKNKSKKNSHYEFFSSSLISQFESNFSIENGIRKAIKENQFEVYFQPQFNINTQKISGVEALIRWNHPEKGLIMPDSFIPIAEETNLICDIGNWVLDASMKVIQQWNQNIDLQGIVLAINISAIQFIQADFVDTVLNTLDKYKIKGSQIELEITENIMLDDIQLVVSKLKQLGHHGIRFAIDDFGMGYSSLSYIQELPLNNLKIDRSFISSIQTEKDSNSIITAIVAMAKDMKMEIVAEGVENEIQLNYVHSLGCPIVQGYYFAKPMNSKDAKDFALRHIN